MLAEFVIAYQRAERRTAVDAVLFLVYLFEQGALIEFRGALQVLEKFFFGAVQTLILSWVPVSL